MIQPMPASKLDETIQFTILKDEHFKNRHKKTFISMMPPQSDEEYSPQEMLSMLRQQVEMGADEALLDQPLEMNSSSIMANASSDVIPQAPSAVQNTEFSEASNAILASKTFGQSSGPYQAPVSPAPDLISDHNWGDYQDLEALKQACTNFDGCGLKKTASNMVFSDGNPDADIMLIGEAPGADEDRQGKPFVGVSGQLLDRMMASIGLNRSSLYISNIILWRPPGNRTPTTEEIAAFLPIMKRHIQLVAPKVIVTLGGSSTKALLGTQDGILKCRGKWHEFDHGKGTIPLLATLHPAYLLRTPGQKALAWQDLRMLHQHVKNI